MSDFSSNWSDLTRALDTMQRHYAQAGAQARLDVERRVRRWSHEASATLGRIAHAGAEVGGVRNALAVRQALDASRPRFVELLRQEFAGLNFATVVDVLVEVMKQMALYLGGGAVVGAAAGGALGSLALGVGAIPGAAVGAQAGAAIGGEILVWMGLGMLVMDVGSTVPDLCRQFAHGFATAWHAGDLPADATARRTTMLRQATDSFAQGQMLLVKAVLTALVLYLSRRQVQSSLLVRNLSKSRLGPKFAEWVGENRDKLMAHPALRPRIVSAQGQAEAGKGGAAKAAAETPKPAGKPSAVKRGEAEHQPPCTLVGQPVDPIRGSKILLGDLDLDFALPAPLPLVWQRTYSSALHRAGWLGQGWALPISDSLQLSADEVVVLDAFDRGITFSLPRIGDAIYSPSEQVTLARTGDTTFELVDNNGLRTQFAVLYGDGIARLTGWQDANDNRIRITYDARRLPARIDDSAGRGLALEFGRVAGGMRLLGVTLMPAEPERSAHTLVSYDYDDAGDLRRVRNRAGDVVRQFGYRNHVMVEHGQPDGLVSRYEYDEEGPDGKVLRNWTNLGQWWEFRYRDRETVVTDQMGRTQTYRFDARGRLVAQVDAAGGVTTRRLDDNGNLLELTDPAGRAVRYRYDERSRIVRVERGGRGTGIVYDARFDKPALITDALGATTVLRYDAQGNLASVTNALGQRTAYQYDDRGLPVKVIDARGGVKELAYNRAGQLIRYTDCSGSTSSFDYDDEGRLVRALDPNGNASLYAYDALGRLQAVTHADGTTERYEYDRLGRLVAHVDAAGHRTAYELDRDGKPLKRIDARGGALEYRYDTARRIAELINENGDVHRFVYDALDRLAEETSFDARVTRYRYDDSGLIVGKDELGCAPRTELTPIATTYVRDALGQLTEKVISRVTGAAQAQQMRLRFAYDALGRMTRAVNADAVVSMAYDAVGQLVSEQTDASGTSVVLRHVYDELGNRVQTTLPDGRILNNLYYGSGHLHQVNLDGEVVTDIERDRAHRMISRTQGVLVSQFRYDPVGRLLAQTAGEGGSAVIARKYEYDEVGNLVSIDDQRNGVTRYSYDPIGRILSAVQPQSNERFAFDPAHNLLDTTVANVGRVEGNRIRVYEDKRYDYDAHGNVVEKLVGRHTRMRFEWNPAHQLVRSVVERGQSGSAQTVSYAYDPFGRRIAKRDAFGVTRFVWDGNRLLCEQRGSHARTYVYGEDAFVPLARVDAVVGVDGAARAEVRHLHTDHLGTPREMTDADGRVVWAARYRAWGNVLEIVQEEVSEVLSPEEIAEVQPVRFQGQYCDSETGLHYNRFRYYDPDIGRFVSVDPIGLTGGANLFKYAANPLSWIDPLGLSPCNPINSQKRVGYGEKGQGSGNKIDQISNRQVLDSDGQPIPIYERLKSGPFAVQEFPSAARAHGFPDIVDNYAGGAIEFPLRNGATLYQIEGGFNGAAGRFEWIVDPKLGGVTHRMFVPGGTINGIPIKP
ncbi:RHS repeat-associated core domain-containing protein [Massilia sp. PDC64]|nr:RHS repeat-associated core domain-containing protein [Massilia sp. PDC64]SDD08472.1 RHS repeat-associated core domain-containing protein [Massilia sp. PDC64]